ncbi:hypothetical protein EC609_19080 [Achromobacter denitrificans]|nr:hypothetical protein EC609_19080 [Achromobacter denitrificans]
MPNALIALARDKRPDRYLRTEAVADYYGVTENVVLDTYARHAEHFVTGRDFNRLEAGVILWTPAGALRFSKLLDTDQAWQTWDALEDAYFGGAA